MKRIVDMGRDLYSFAPVVVIVAVILAATFAWRKHQADLEAAVADVSMPARPAKPNEYRGPTAAQAARILGGPADENCVEDER